MVPSVPVVSRELDDDVVLGKHLCNDNFSPTWALLGKTSTIETMIPYTKH